MAHSNRSWFPAAATLLLIVGGACYAQDTSADVSIGGQVVMRLRGVAGGMSAADRVGIIEDRLTRIITFPHIRPSDVVVFTPAGKPPVIYALGRRVVTVDPATVAAGGGGDAKSLAIQWAKNLQQILPRVDIRLPNEPEPVIPANPPLQITNSFLHVGGNVGGVYLDDKLVMRLHTPSSGGLTAVERADIIGARLRRLLKETATDSADNITVSPPPTGNPNAPVQILIGGAPLLTVDQMESKAAQATTPMSLAASWAKNIGGVLTASAQIAPQPLAPVTVATPTTPPNTTAATQPATPATPNAVTPTTPTPSAAATQPNNNNATSPAPSTTPITPPAAQ